MIIHGPTPWFREGASDQQLVAKAIECGNLAKTLIGSFHRCSVSAWSDKRTPSPGSINADSPALYLDCNRVGTGYPFPSCRCESAIDRAS
jgi:hypothetical protein